MERLRDWALENWQSPWAPIALGTAVLGPLGLLLSELTWGGIAPGEWAILGLTAVAVGGVWVATGRLKRHPPGRIAFGIAVYSDDRNQDAQLRADLIRDLKRYWLERQAFAKPSFISYPSAYARRLETSDDARAFAKRTRSHFLVYGRARKTTIDDKQNHFLEIEGVVMHSPIRKELSKTISLEFTEVFPRSSLIAEEGDLFAFRFTAEWVGTVSRYMTGIAALVSGDLDYSEHQFKTLEAELKGRTALPPGVSIIKNRLSARLADVYRSRLHYLLAAFFNSFSRERLEAIEAVLHDLDAYYPDYYPGLLQGAICDFLLRRDVKAAHAKIDRAGSLQVPDGTWRFSKAFLRGYEGDLKGAYNEYRSAMALPFGGDIPLQAEAFIHHIIEEEPERVHLYFCLGLINHRIKGDLAAARRDFDSLLSSTDPTRFQREHELARKWIRQIDLQLGRGAKEGPPFVGR